MQGRKVRVVLAKEDDQQILHCQQPDESETRKKLERNAAHPVIICIFTHEGSPTLVRNSEKGNIGRSGMSGSACT